MKNVIYKSGDVLEAKRIDNVFPLAKGVIIPHVCNNQGGWGSGFVVNLSKKWTEPEMVYRHRKDNSGYPLGDVDFIEVGTLWNNTIIANMIAQEGFRSYSNPVAVNYEALKICLSRVYCKAAEENHEVHTIRIGCGLGGGDWNVVEKILNDMVERTNVTTVVYDL